MKGNGSTTTFLGRDVEQFNGMANLAIRITHHGPSQVRDLTSTKAGFKAEKKNGTIAIRVSTGCGHFQRGF